MGRSVLDGNGRNPSRSAAWPRRRRRPLRRCCRCPRPRWRPRWPARPNSSRNPRSRRRRVAGAAPPTPRGGRLATITQSAAPFFLALHRASAAAEAAFDRVVVGGGHRRLGHQAFFGRDRDGGVNRVGPWRPSPASWPDPWAAGRPVPFRPRPLGREEKGCGFVPVTVWAAAGRAARVARRAGNRRDMAHSFIIGWGCHSAGGGSGQGQKCC